MMKNYTVTLWNISLFFIGTLLLFSFPQVSISQVRANLRKVTVSRGDTLIVAGILTSEKVNRFDRQAYYHWYSSNKTHINQGAYTGNLVHGEYLELDAQGRMIVMGNFNYGLKNGQWLQWYPDGSLYQSACWKKGYLHGGFSSFNSSRAITFHGRYRAGKPRGSFFILEDGIPHKSFYLGGKELYRRSLEKRTNKNEDED